MACDVPQQSSLALPRPSVFLHQLLASCEGSMMLLERTRRRRTVLCAWRMALTVAHGPCCHAEDQEAVTEAVAELRARTCRRRWAFMLWASSVARGGCRAGFVALD